EVGLLARLDALKADAIALAEAGDPALLTGAEAEQVLAGFGRVRNVVSGAMAGYAARVTETERWRLAGARSADAHLGSLTGGSTGSGRRLAETGRRLVDAPEAKKALAEGRLSLDQAEQVAGAVSETVGSPDDRVAGGAAEVERRLLEVAAGGDLAGLRDAAAQAKQAARDEARTRRVQHDTRQLRKRSFDDGSVGGQFKLPPWVAGEVWAVLDRLTEHRFDQQRRAGVRDQREAYAADALCAALGIEPSVHPDRDVPAAGEPDESDEQTSANGEQGKVVGEPRVNIHKELVVVVDADSLRNGTVGPDGTCEIPGVGPVPVQAARDLLGEVGVSIVVNNGVDIANVTLGGRRLSKSMRLAMLAGHGWRCGDCGTPYRLQNDHDKPYAITRHTRLDELRPRCEVCHGVKTRREASLTAEAGRDWHRAAANIIAALTLILLPRGP
ncbi:MAG: hypothetical protein ACR2H3_10425, partial [Acidimicrobiales bacterium]